jgi:antiviral helicase SKI2
MVSIITKPFEGELKHPFKYDLDNFQKHSVNLMNTVSPCNILVTAYTGSGKSLVAEYAILKAKELGKKSIYCSPIKTLSNQKFYEFTHKYKDISFGIITGDNKHNPMADCLIMTTEILMIMLSKNEIKIDELTFNIDIEKEVYAIVFDEVHYINDMERGNVWEKSLMTIPKNISIIMLSATIDKPANFLTWVHTCNNNPSYLLTNEKRVVPLQFSYGLFIPRSFKLPKEMKKYEPNMNFFTNIMDTDTKHMEEDAINKYLHLSKYFKDNKVNFRWLIGETCRYLSTKGMCPAIFFVFSKKTCFFLAESIAESYNDSNESKQVERDIAYYLSKLEHKDDYMKTPQYYQMVSLAKKGIAVHHSGLIPVFKEIIELLFSKNLIKILFATETFAVGLNMPTKTVLFTDIFKHDKDGKRMLYSHEFIQMSGRAGRRGLDTRGYVILLPQIFTESLDKISFRSLMLGSPQTIKSKFYVDENLILDSVRKNSLDLTKIEDFVKKTLMNSELDKEKLYLDSKISDLDKRLKGYVFKNYEIFVEKEGIVKELSDFIQPSTNQKKKLLARLKEIEESEDFKLEASNYNSFTDVTKNYSKLKDERDNLDVFIKNDIESKLAFLTKYEYFDDKVLTLKGNVALLFRELDGVIGAEIVFSEYVDELNEKEYLSLITLLTDGRDIDSEIPKDSVDIICFVNDMFPYHVPNREYVNPIRDWYDGKHISDIINQYKIFEGDLIKNINRIINYIEEINEGYIMKNSLSKVEMLNKIKDRLQREIVSTESLYLRL